MRNSRIFRIAAGIAFPLAILAVIFWVYFISRPLPCVIYNITGLFCPSCGATRAIISLMHGDVTAALRNNIIITISVIPVFILLIRLWLGIILCRPNFFTLSKSAIWIICVFAGFFILFGFVRNIPIPPFIYLNPVNY